MATTLYGGLASTDTPTGLYRSTAFQCFLASPLANQTGIVVPMGPATQNVSYWIPAFSGSIAGMSIVSGANVTAGSITFTITGTTGSTASIIINTVTNTANITFSKDTVSFAVGAGVQCTYTTSAAYADASSWMVTVFAYM